MTSCSIIIPTLNAEPLLAPLVDQLRNQTVTPLEIIAIDSSSDDGTLIEAKRLGMRTITIPRAEFNHGGTRNTAALKSQGDILVFLTQDALPLNPSFLQELTAPIANGLAAASYARQLPKPTARLTEFFARTFNYPENSVLRTAKDIPRLGIRAYFFSNVASAIKKDIFLQEGMFRNDVIMNEDMLFCAKLLDSGKSIMYCARSQVIHSHNYGFKQTFKRYFDIGVFYSRHIKNKKLKINKTGRNYSIELFKFIIEKNRYQEILFFIFETIAKSLGFYIGRYEKYIPNKFKQRLSLHSSFWNMEKHTP